MPTTVRYVAIFIATLVLSSCASNYYRAGTACLASAFEVQDSFAGARRGTCKVTGDNSVQIAIRPESDGYINNSPWYAFKLVPSAPGDAVINIRYYGGNHRYAPKVSSDGLTWTPLDESNVTVSENRRDARVVVPLDGEPLFVAAQEVIPPMIYDAWNARISNEGGYSVGSAGTSLRGLNIPMFDTNPDGRDVLLLIGRQHPPEVSGAIAFFAFTEVILGDSDLATKFRERYRVIAVPMLNPDGVTGGNWRHNLDDTDLNRDWGPFKQPETAAVGELLDRIDAEGSRLRVFLDFHSTRENIFYTMTEETDPPGFATEWLTRSDARIGDDYPFSERPGAPTNTVVAKNYIFLRYGIPSITYEVGDESDRVATRKAAVVFAEELMQLMLEQPL